jgi:hypothetical protein
MGNIFLKKNFYEFPNVQYRYSLNSLQYEESILYKLDSITEDHIIWNQDEPARMLNDLQMRIVNTVNNFLIPKMKNGDFPDEYTLPFEE